MLMNDRSDSYRLHGLGAKVILLVEDEAVLRKLLARTLEEYGYFVIEAGDGQAALDACDQFSHPIDLVFTDVVMPRMSGPELMARLASTRPGIKVVYTSAYADHNTARQGSPWADQPYLQKPFGPDDLLKMVRESLESRDAA
jgi:CheY-like chemotaxis protein